MLTNFFKALMVISVVLGVASSAGAFSFALDSFDVALRDQDPGLALWWEPVLTTPVSKEFEVGDELTFDLFKIGTNEKYVNLFEWDWSTGSFVEEDIEEFPIATTFNFSSPSVTEAVSGFSDGKWRLLRDDYGLVEWDGPAEFAWGETGLFTIELSDVDFGTPGHDIVQATFTYESAPVPEPGTILLMGSGLLGLAAYRRKRKVSNA
jgi:hypothetical protein